MGNVQLTPATALHALLGRSAAELTAMVMTLLAFAGFCVVLSVMREKGE